MMLKIKLDTVMLEVTSYSIKCTVSTTQDDGNTENFMAHVAVDIQGT